jgi:formylglycine-generating enzyme required for sulfatase activity
MTIRLLALVCVMAATAFGVVGAGAQQSDQRVALLIGNANYPDASAPLAHPGKSVRALAEELRRSGFDVDTKENLGKEEMQRAIDAFKQKIRPGAAALFFFDGYGLQVSRQSFIIPINAQIWAENDIRRDGISIEAILNDLNSRGARVKILVIDASRRNPYERRFRQAPSGLATIDAPAGTLMISAVAPGKVIENDGENSIFMGELVKEMRASGLTAEEIFSRTRIGVSRASNGEQVPWVSSSLVDEFYFLQPSGRAGGAALSDTRPSPPPPPPVSPPPQRPVVQTPPPPPPQPQREAAAPARPDNRASGSVRAGDVFRDCRECPELVVVPAGDFDMGSNDFEYEKPIHKVTIPKGFAIGRREVTFEEWDQCSASGACTYRPDDHGGGRGERPVTDVSWRDVKVYLTWLSQKTGQTYRLPSEAEWEYAARGGTKTSFWWGRDAGARYANCRDCGGNNGDKAIATASYAANPYGLFDTAGNAAEWVEDCWNDNYRGAPRDSAAWTSGQCGQRVLRGGSFDSQSRYVRSSSRFRYDVDVRYYANGFRVVRELR